MSWVRHLLEAQGVRGAVIATSIPDHHKKAIAMAKSLGEVRFPVHEAVTP